MSDEKDQIIAHLQRELARHKEMLTGVYVKRNQMEKIWKDRGDRITRLNNENQKLKAAIRKMENAGIEPTIVTPARRRWKTTEAA
jgi:hypothetical protein